MITPQELRDLNESSITVGRFTELCVNYGVRAQCNDGKIVGFASESSKLEG